MARKTIEKWAERNQPRSVIAMYAMYLASIVAVWVGGNMLRDGLGYFVAGLLVWLELLLMGKLR